MGRCLLEYDSDNDQRQNKHGNSRFQIKSKSVDQVLTAAAFWPSIILSVGSHLFCYR